MSHSILQCAPPKKKKNVACCGLSTPPSAVREEIVRPSAKFLGGTKHREFHQPKNVCFLSFNQRRYPLISQNYLMIIPWSSLLKPYVFVDCPILPHIRLVGGFNPSEKMWVKVSWDDFTFPTQWKKIDNLPNHPPVLGSNFFEASIAPDGYC